MNLNGEERQQLQTALIRAFPSVPTLQHMLMHGLSLNLYTIAGGSNLSEIVFNLIDWAEAQGRTSELIAAAWAENPGNSDLCAFRDYLEKKQSEGKPHRSAHIFISYKRHTKLDEPLALRLREEFIQAGHSVFIDQGMQVGVHWAHEIQRQIMACDYMVVLLSKTSVQSEMVAKETLYAYRYSQQCIRDVASNLSTDRSQQQSKACLLPVRVDYHEELPYRLSQFLDKIQYVEWNSDADTHRLIQQLLDAINTARPLPLSRAKDSLPMSEPLFEDIPHPPFQADPRFVTSLVEPGGGLKVRSDFYIERESDARLQRVIVRGDDVTVTIRGSRQTGKTSLLIRGIAQARNLGRKVVSIDLQAVEARHRESLDTFLRYFATMLCIQLRLDPAEVDRAWESNLGAQDKTTYFIEDYILQSVDSPVVLALDEIDRLTRTSFHDDFFGLVRSWHNRRAHIEAWDHVHILMAISTEPHLLIKDFTQSPFNVGERIVMKDMDTAQVAALSQRYRLALDTKSISLLTTFLGGHPYLTSKALYTMVTEAMPLQKLLEVATTQQSPFGDHLRRYLWVLQDHPDLRDALKQIISHGRCATEQLFYRLQQAGLVCGEGHQSCQCRCTLYEHFFKEKL